MKVLSTSVLWFCEFQLQKDSASSLLVCVSVQFYSPWNELWLFMNYTNFSGRLSVLILTLPQSAAALVTLTAAVCLIRLSLFVLIKAVRRSDDQIWTCSLWAEPELPSSVPHTLTTDSWTPVDLWGRPVVTPAVRASHPFLQDLITWLHVGSRAQGWETLNYIRAC